MLKRDEHTARGAGADERPLSPIADDDAEWTSSPRLPAAATAPPPLHAAPILLTDADRAAIEAANEDARRRRAEAYAAMAPQTGEFERAPAPKTAAMILLENVTKIYPGDVVGLRDVSLQIDKGEWVFLVGASGSGKSTLIKLLLKEIDATRGNLIVGGRSLSKLRRAKVPLLRRNIGCVFQDFKLLPTRTVFENVAYALEVQGKRRADIDRKVPEIIQLVGLADKIDKYPHELSGGQQQRVSIARAFVNHPPLLICDEPTGNLDPDTSIGIMQLLYRIQRTGTTVLMATHDREMVDKMRRRVVALEDGRVVRDDRRGGYVVEPA
jgi:cell division transport system ATP-binding protein